MSFAETFDEQLAETRSRIDAAMTHCDEIGRDPSTLRVSYDMFDPASRASGGQISYYESAEAFTELGLYYPMLEEQLSVFETIAVDTLPRLRAENQTAA